MTRLDLEGAVICPKVNGNTNAGNAALVNLSGISSALFRRRIFYNNVSHHLSGLSTANRELEIGIFLPVAEEEREAGEESVVCVSGCGNRLWR